MSSMIAYPDNIIYFGVVILVAISFCAIIIYAELKKESEKK